jgi:hypothetical protein
VSRWLTLIIVLHLAVGLVYDWATPIFEASDEGAHYAFIHWLAQGHPLPIQESGAPEKTWAQEGSQPPLYYFLGASLTRWVDSADFEQVFVQNPFARVGIPGTTHNVNLYRHPLERAPLIGAGAGNCTVKIVRWFSLLLSGITIYLTARLAQRVFPDQKNVALLAAALVAFNPMALFINASVNNDNLLMLLSTATLLAVVQLTPLDVERNIGQALGLGLLLGLAALTKVSGLVLWPVAALGVGWRELGRLTAFGRRPPFGDLRQSAPFRGSATVSGLPFAVFHLAIIFGMALALSGWWFWRNYVLYGEWLGLNTMVAVAGPRVPPITLLDLIRNEWYGFYLSYWGVFGVFTILPAAWVLYFFHALTLWALAGGVWTLVKWRRWPSAELMLLALFCGLTLIGVTRWTMQTFASQGRLMFGAIAPLSIFMAAGILATVGPLTPPGDHRAGRVAGGVTLILSSALFLVAAIIPVAYIAPRYAFPPVIAASDLPENLREVRVKFGEVIELIGYTVDDAPRHPGEPQPVTLYWRAPKPMMKDYALFLHLLGRGATEVGKIDTWPGGGNAPTSQWRPGTIFADRYLISIDPQAITPSLLHLDLGFWDGALENKLPITAPAGEPLSSVKVRVGRVVSEDAPQFTPEISEGSTFEYGITLLGLDISAEGAIYLILYWRLDSEQPIPADYTVFVHLIDSQGILVTQADGPPLEGDWPTSAWIPGHAFADTRLFALPPNLHAGRYSLRLGFYDPTSETRLNAFRADGTPWPENMVIIRDVIEIK